MLKSYDASIFFSQWLKSKFWSHWSLLSRMELSCCKRGGGWKQV